jgi:glycosyltransferase EpsD
VVTLNREDAKRTVRWHRTDSNKIHVIPHGVDCDHYRFDPAARSRLLEQIDQNGSEASSLIVGSAGRLVHGKGIDLLLHAVKRLRDNGITATTLIAGGGDAEDELKELAVELGITDHVHFFGFVDDMAGFYSACDVFVLPSMTESFGLAIAEAMACERAVVATPTSGASRQIRHRKNGWQLNRFEPNELAEALAMLGGDADLRRELGIQARIDVRRCFSIDLTLERTLRAFRGVSHERSRLRWPGMKSEPFVRMTTEDLG